MIEVPYDLDAEVAVLGSLLLDTEAMRKIGWLSPEHFYREKNRWIYECCQSLTNRKEPTNQITVAHELAKRKQLEAVSPDYLSHCVSQTPTSVHVEYYADIVKTLAIKRALMVVGSKITSHEGEPEDVIADARKMLDEIARQQNHSKLITPHEWAHYMEDRYSKLRNKEQHSLPFGFPSLDRVTGGAFGGEFIVLGARPKVGKSTILNQFAHSFALYGNVLFAQAEMSRSQMADRDVAYFVRVKAVRVRTGNYPDEMFDEIQGAIGEASETKIYRYIDGAMTTKSLRSVAYEMQDRHGVGAIIVDYMQILKDKSSASPYEQTKYISSELLGLCNDLDIPLVCASQLNRELEKRQDKRPQMSDFRESGTIEQDCDVLMSLYRRDVYPNCPDDEKGKAELHILAHRQGASLRPINLAWIPQQRYEEGV